MKENKVFFIIISIAFIIIILTACSKTAVFTGESANWKGKLVFKYSVERDALISTLTLSYKHANIDSVGTVQYEVIGNKFKLSDIEPINYDGNIYTQMGNIGYTRPSESTVFTVIVKWKGNTETFRMISN